MKKRILVLNYEFPPLGGGASPVSYEIAKRLSETGDFDIDVVTMGYKGLSKYQEINANFRVHRVKCWRSKKELSHPWEQATYLISGWFKCKELLRKNKYDMCHCHFIIPTGILALRLKKKFGLPYVVTSHGSDIPDYNPDRFTFVHKFTKPFLRLVLNNSNFALTGSQYLADLANKIDSIVKYQVIREGFDSTKFTPQIKKRYILSTGRLYPRKGFQILIQAVSDEDIGYEVHIAGDGPQMLQLKELAKKSKTKITFHGWMNNTSKEYKDLLEQTAIFVLASERENSSVSLLEAMNAGCAVITTNVSGCPETVDSAGILIKVNDAADLKSKINDLVNNPIKIISLQKAAVERVKQAYNWNTILKKYYVILK